ncbi:MAG: hypothetical protein H8E59_01670 [Actinobacteria bacterium]|nr:hypothetical protein [Actinomycetota bacterium]
MDALTAARQIAEPVQVLGARFMLDGATFGRCAQLGLPAGLASYALGRLGVLGDVEADTACEAAFFFTPEVIHGNWTPTDALSPSAAGAIYAQVCAEMGRVYLDGFAGSGRLAALAATVVDAADPTAADLFAGWRNQPRPDDDPGRAYLLVQTLRELRGCRHIAAARAAGADPHGLVLANGGPAALFGWPDEGEPVDSAVRDAIEAATDAASAADLSPLSDDERAELAELATAAHAHATA